ncbi:MAG: hypothetical protein DSO07_12395 [Thermoproteota archaeon]|nr:MAG: hypothetical protein DSO07_12395 [Candidatus Korarchaeota archaeon]
MIYIDQDEVKLRNLITLDDREKEALIMLERYGFDPFFCPICKSERRMMIFVSWDDLIAHIKAIHGQDVMSRGEKGREIWKIWNWEDIW